MSTRTMAVVISALFCASFASEALAYPCNPSATDPDGMRTCDTFNSLCPSYTGNSGDEIEANYTTDTEAWSFIQDLDFWVDGSSEYMAVIPLGDVFQLDLSLGSPAGSAIPPGALMYVVRITEDAIDPDVTKPALLLNAGVHPQEWIAQETALGLVDWLVRAANDKSPYKSDKTRVRDLLSEREIWIVVMANPVGRVIDGAQTNDGVPAWSEIRKNRQWETAFECSDEWENAYRGGRCYPEISSFATGYPTGGGAARRWHKPGINVGNNFSYGWARRESVRFKRDLIFDNVDQPYSDPDAPELFDCDDNDSNCEFFGDINTAQPGNQYRVCKPHYWPGSTDPIYGCFVAGPQATENDCLDQLYNAVDGWHAEDLNGVVHRICLETQTSPGSSGATEYLPWECGVPGSLRHDATDNAAIDCLADPASCPQVLPDNLLKNCTYGTLKSCIYDTDCLPSTPGLGISQVDFETSSMGMLGGKILKAPHWMGTTEMNAHLYCSGGYCSIDDHRTCCDTQYSGQRPFETIEARLIRELVNNVPFTAVIDMHSSRSDLKFRCPNVGYGCYSTNRFFKNGDGLEAEMVAVYNTAAGQHWSPIYGTALPSFLGLIQKNENTHGEGHGYLAGWTAGKPESTSSATAPGNFDNGTVKALPSFTWELGTLPGASGGVWEDVVGCNNTSNLHGGQPRSRLMVENQLEGARELVMYMAEESLTPGVGRDNSGFAISPGIRRDIGVSGLRIHDGHGRGIQQTEVGADAIGDLDADQNAKIVVPAGIWAVSADVQAGLSWSSGFYSQLNADVTIELKRLVPSISVSVWQTEDTYHFSGTLEPETHERITTHFKLEAGELYRIEAKVDNPFGEVYDNDTLANDSQIIKVKVLDCDDTSDLPNGLGEDEFCQKGIPFDDDSFECNSSTGRCMECWSNYPEQICEGLGAFCYEGMCDDPVTCWSGEIEDIYEGAGGYETSPLLWSHFTQTMTRSLHLEPGSSGVPVQDIDSFFIDTNLGAVVLPSVHLTVKVHNKCSYGFVIPGDYMAELEVRVQQQALPLLSGVYTNITDPLGDGWIQIERFSGLDMTLSAGVVTAIRNGQQLRIQLKNDDTNPESFPYVIETLLDVNGASAVLYEPEQWLFVPIWVKIIGCLGVLRANVQPGEALILGPSLSGMNAGGSIVYMPDLGFEPTALSAEMVMRDKFGDVPVGGDGRPIGFGQPIDGGLGIVMDELIADNGPFTVTLYNEQDAMEGRIYLCPAGTNDCSAYEPERDICGVCDQDGESCCIQPDGTYTCEDLVGDDDLNCGACNVACEWDEFCLEGVCASGGGTSCWNTTCTGGTVCVSDDWFWQTNPSCKAILVDPDHCGWFGDTCEYNESCTFGFCAPKMRQACDIECGLGESCCWVWGVETCIDTDSGLFNCGGCGNVCPVGTLCEGGICEWWHDLYDPCPGNTVNCNPDGLPMDCKLILSDDDNCGGCGILCSDTGACIGGVCIDQSTADAADSGEME